MAHLLYAKEELLPQSTFSAGGGPEAALPPPPPAAALKPPSSEPSFLIGDIGGTHMRFWVVPCVAPCYPTTAQASFATSYATASFANVVDAFTTLRQDLAQHNVHESSIARCTLAVCGPVIDGRAVCLGPSMGPTGWVIDERVAAATLGIAPEGKCRIINDFVAVGLALPLVRHAAHVVHPGDGIDDDAPMACIGPGTGLGECLCIPTLAPPPMSLPTPAPSFGMSSSPGQKRPRATLPNNQGGAAKEGGGTVPFAKAQRCGQCLGCTRPDCGTCFNCRDKPKYGGPGVKKQGA
jgi:hypothetical protein